MNERLDIDIDGSSEKTKMHETMNYMDQKRDYNEIYTNHTPIPETTTSEDKPKQSELPITDEWAITTATKWNNKRSKNKSERCPRGVMVKAES